MRRDDRDDTDDRALSRAQTLRRAQGAAKAKPSGLGSSLAPTRDLTRLRAILDRIAAGEAEDDATWAVLSDPSIGTPRHIQRALAGRRPSNQRLAVTRTRLIERVAPYLAEAMTAQAAAEIAAQVPEIARAVTRLATGQAEGCAHQVAAARLAMQAVGMIQTGSRSTIHTATQVNVSAEHEATVRHARQVMEAEIASRDSGEAERMADECARRYDEWMDAEVARRRDLAR